MAPYIADGYEEHVAAAADYVRIYFHGVAHHPQFGVTLGSGLGGSAWRCKEKSRCPPCE